MDRYDDTIDTQFLEFRGNIDLSICLLSNLIDQVEGIHKAGFVHNDIKPNNIVFDHTANKFRLIDFGEASCYLDL